MYDMNGGTKATLRQRRFIQPTIQVESTGTEWRFALFTSPREHLKQKVHSLILHTKREKRDYNAYKKQVQKCYKYTGSLIPGLDPIWFLRSIADWIMIPRIRIIWIMSRRYPILCEVRIIRVSSNILPTPLIYILRLLLLLIGEWKLGGGVMVRWS